MKKIYTILTISLILSMVSMEVKAQIVKGEAFLGMNLSQIDGDKAYGYRRFGLHGGFGGMVPVFQKGNFSIDFSMEIAFNQRGSHQGRQYTDTVNGKIYTGEYDTYMNYLEVPVLFYFTDKGMYSIGLGASYGRLVGLKEYEHGELTNVNLSYNGPDKYNLNDFAFIADIKFRIYERLKLGVRYQYSMAKIRTRDFYLINGEFDCTRNQYNNSITARLIYVFNEDRDKYVYDDYEFRGDNPRIHQKAIDKKIRKLKRKQAREEKRNQQ